MSEIEREMLLDNTIFGSTMGVSGWEIRVLLFSSMVRKGVRGEGVWAQSHLEISFTLKVCTIIMCELTGYQ